MKGLISSLRHFKFVDYEAGGPSLMKIATKEYQAPAESHLLMKIKAIGLNRAEVMLRQGKYPTKTQQDKLLGLEAAGEVYDHQTGEKLFDAMTLLEGGSYAQYVPVRESYLVRIPSHMSFVEAAGVPQTWLTSLQLLRMAKLQPREKVLIFAGASGVGTSAIQLCKYFGSVPFGVTSSPEKVDLCRRVGAKGYSYKDHNWAEELLKQTGNKGFDVILDCVGASHYPSTLKLLGLDSRWVVFATMGGSKVELDMNQLFRTRTTMFFTTLKTRSPEYKTQLIEDFKRLVLPGFETGELNPIVGKVLRHDWSRDDASAFVEGHQMLENNLTQGKVVIQFE